MSFKLPFLSRRSGDEDDDEFSDDEDDRPGLLARLFGRKEDEEAGFDEPTREGRDFIKGDGGVDVGAGNEDEEREPGNGRTRWRILGAGFLAVLLIGAGTGYYLMTGQDPTASETAEESPPDEEETTEDDTIIVLATLPLPPVDRSASWGSPGDEGRGMGGSGPRQGAGSKTVAPTGVKGGGGKPAPILQEPSAAPVPADIDPTPPAFDRLPAPPAATALRKAPVAELVAQSVHGPLPVIAPSGQTPLKAYARPFTKEKNTPRLAIILTDLGLKRVPTEAAIDRTPAEVTLAFSAYGFTLKTWAERARAAGHEILLTLPMEGHDFPVQDPGPLGLLTTLSQRDNQTRLEMVLARATGYTGLVASGGERFLTSTDHIVPVVDALRERGLLFVDNGAAGGQSVIDPAATALAVVDLVVDEKNYAGSIDARLRHLVALAKERKRAVAIATATPLTLKRLSLWWGGLDKEGVALAPVSALISFQE
ncbi:MAG: hypothetical protein FD149_148 [Rhodospirillaceae bacterium]|nr:MAG: hypothetical protein FD149_148 [Rhodospirillaceae bacterium]